MRRGHKGLMGMRGMTGSWARAGEGVNRVVMFRSSPGGGGGKANLTSNGEGRERKCNEANVKRYGGGMS